MLMLPSWRNRHNVDATMSRTRTRASIIVEGVGKISDNYILDFLCCGR